MARLIYRPRRLFDVVAKDGHYVAEICEICKQYKAWEVDRNNDTSMSVTEKTGKYRVRFFPEAKSMEFPEDLNRKQEYEMSGNNIAKMYEHLANNVQYWFALDMASFLCD